MLQVGNKHQKDKSAQHDQETHGDTLVPTAPPTDEFHRRNVVRSAIMVKNCHARTTPSAPPRPLIQINAREPRYGGLDPRTPWAFRGQNIERARGMMLPSNRLERNTLSYREALWGAAVTVQVWAA